MAALPAPVQLPADGQPSPEFCRDLEQALLKATWEGVHGTAAAMPPELLARIVQSATAITSKEPTLLEVQPAAQQQRVTVVGDTHGQFHDVCKLFELYGHPSAERIYIFNGDFVDRGAWGVEVLALLMAYKWMLPHNVFLVRGNHESHIITQVYGFAAELKAKYGKTAKGLYTHMKRFFASLPLAALVENSTLILHGGLFRAPPAKAKAGGKRRRSTGVKLSVGTLDDLRKASKGGQDPDPDRSMKNLVACDVLWSDPVNDPGIRVNEARGCGTVFGPDVTAEFLSANGLRLIIRSHEGPDARDKRVEGDKMPSVDSGYAEDHVTDSGKLVTLFSAPDYPQFIAEGEDRYHNKAAVLHLTGPDYSTPQVESFEAVLPRPQVESYYEVPSYTEDEEDEGEQQQGSEATAGGTEATEAGSNQQPGDRQATAATEDTASTATAATAGEDADAVPAGAGGAAGDGAAAAAAGATSPAPVPVPVPAAAAAGAQAAAAAAQGLPAEAAAAGPSAQAAAHHHGHHGSDSHPHDAHHHGRRGSAHAEPTAYEAAVTAEAAAGAHSGHHHPPHQHHALQPAVEGGEAGGAAAAAEASPDRAIKRQKMHTH